MSQTSDLLLQGLTFASGEVPATVTIDGQAYAGTTNGLRRTAELAAHGLDKLPRIAFVLPFAAFTALGKPIPVVDSKLVYGALALSVEETAADPTGTLLLIRCKGVTR